VGQLSIGKKKARKKKNKEEETTPQKYNVHIW